MSELDRLIALQEEQSKENADLKRQMAAQSAAAAEQSAQIAQLLARISVQGAGQLQAQVQAPTAAEVRKSEISKLYLGLKKSYKVKDYKEGSGENIREWIAKYDLEVENIAKMSCNLDLSANPLSREEYINCIKENFEYSVI